MRWPFDRPGAQLINRARLEHLAGLELDLKGKRVLEVGAGIGLLTAFWEDRGCDVVSTEGRPENVAENLRRHPWREERVKLLNLDEPGSHDHLGEFDIVFMYGTLYHLEHPLEALCGLAGLCKGLFLLSTCVHHCDNGHLNKCQDPITFDQGLTPSSCCRPARNLIMAELDKLYNHTYVTCVQPKHTEFPLHWPAPPGPVLTRAVFVGSSEPLDSLTLSKKLLMDQDHYLRGCLFEDKWVSLDPRALKYRGSWGWHPIKKRIETADSGHLAFWLNVLKLVKEPTYLDIGANTGSYCLLTKFVLGATCFAFEPNSELVPVLRANIEANELSDQVHVYPFALSDQEGQVTLTIPDDHAGLSTIGTPNFLQAHPHCHTLQVQARTLDSMHFDRVDFIKIDTEGAELPILKGAKRLIERCWPGILAETYSGRSRQLGYDAVEINWWLGNLGYHERKVGNFDTYFWKHEEHER